MSEGRIQTADGQIWGAKKEIEIDARRWKRQRLILGHGIWY
jgi:hypothetical protein